MKQPCVDKYGNDICNLRRFDLGQPSSTPRIPSTQKDQGATTALQTDVQMVGKDKLEVQKILDAAVAVQNQRERKHPVVSSSDARKGFAAAQAAIDAGPLRGWTIDRELSSTEGLVVTKGREIRVAYRGTDFTNVNDLVTDAATVAGYERVAPQMIQSRLQIEAIQAKYGRLPTELLGYSKGGAHAMAMGDRFGIPTTNFNPLVGRKQLMSKSEVPHTIIRTVEDPVSTTLALARGKRNYTVKAIDPIHGLGGPKNAHELTHFTSAGPRQPGGIETLMTEGIRKGQQLAHYETLDAMTSGVEQGKSFTEALDDFNRSNGAAQRVDVLEDGSLGPRIHRESGTVKYWRDAGGKFSAKEQAHLDTNPPPPPREFSDEARAMGLGEELTDAQRRYVASLSPPERVAFMEDQRAALQQHTERINESVRPHQAVIKGLMPRTSSLATGAVAGLVAHATMNVVDPDHKMNRVAEEATEGAMAGAATVGMASALGASAALGPEVLAGASAYIAGSESARAISEALEGGGMSEDAAMGVGSVSGGAIGGVTAAGVGAGATVLGSMAFGAEMGEAVGIIGGPLGVGVGMAAGATLGAAIGGVGYLFSGHHHHSDGRLAYLQQAFGRGGCHHQWIQLPAVERE